MQITQKHLTPNKYSRPQNLRKTTTKIAVHYVGNPGTSADNNRNYFENLRYQNPANDNTINRWVSSNYIVGLQGEIIECVPPDEIAYCTNQANSYSVSIECCHPDNTGKFSDATETALAELCVFLLKKYGLSPNDIIRHYDVTGKQCPLYWSPTKYQPADVANGRFMAFKNRVGELMGAAVTATDTAPVTPFLVRVIDPDLNVRKQPGTASGIVGQIKNRGVFTIVVTAMVGTVPWGKLKSGIGWISLNEKYVKVVNNG